MSDWNLASKRNSLDVARLSKLLKVYDYSTKRSKETDEAFRNYATNLLTKLKNDLTGIMEIAYREKDDIKQNIKRLRDDVDVAMGDIKITDFWKFPESADSLDKIIKSDLRIISNAEGSKNLASTLYSQLLNSQAVEVERKLQEIKKMVNDLRVANIDRRELIKAR
ncbi:MAG: hypothetical protein HY512_01880 [Candidatus Aenigmarchaeota archaeon]|nr:hypothetical protein [Candidatus Aenigmarchaeota archaeon]